MIKILWNQKDNYLAAYRKNKNGISYLHVLDKELKLKPFTCVPLHDLVRIVGWTVIGDL